MMIHFSKSDIEKENRIKRLNLINSISGIKSANLIGTKSDIKGSNLAIFSSIIHLGSSPALLGFILRPANKVPRNTYSNILETGMFTINHVHEDFIKNAHYTSAKFQENMSEFDECGFTEEYLFDFKAPFVKESDIKIGMKYLETIPIPINGTQLVIGQIEHLVLPNHALTSEGYVDISNYKSTGVVGLNTYYKLSKIGTFPFARPSELPNFD